MIMAIWERYNAGNRWVWGVRVDGAAYPGQQITVTRRSGQVSTETVESVVSRDERTRTTLCAVRDTRRGQATPVQAAPAPAVQVTPAPVTQPQPARAAEPVAVPVTGTGDPDWAALGAPQTGRQALRQTATRRSAYSVAQSETPDIARPSAAAIRAGEIVAGAAAGGHGGQTCWGGWGSVPHSTILDWLARAGLPADYAPRLKSAVAHAGKAVGDLNMAGYVCRRTKAANLSRAENERRTWDAQWTIARWTGGNRDDLVTVELPQESDELAIWSHPDRADEAEPIVARIVATYRALRGAEIHGAADVTDWLASVLRRHCGATELGTAWYIPVDGLPIANALVNVVSEEWGRKWMAPIIPLATGAEMLASIARGFRTEVRGQVAQLETDRAAARAETPPRSEIGPRRAATLLRDLQALQDRIAAYRLLCGDALIAPIVVEIGALRDTLAAIADDASLRFALLDLDVPQAQPSREPERASPAMRAADAALEARRARPANEQPARGPAAEMARQTAAPVAPPVARPVAPVAAPPAPEPDDPGPARDDIDQRASLLEWD